jgi:hypothetical protein
LIKFETLTEDERKNGASAFDARPFDFSITKSFLNVMQRFCNGSSCFRSSKIIQETKAHQKE